MSFETQLVRPSRAAGQPSIELSMDLRPRAGRPGPPSIRRRRRPSGFPRRSLLEGPEAGRAPEGPLGGSPNGGFIDRGTPPSQAAGGSKAGFSAPETPHAGRSAAVRRLVPLALALLAACGGEPSEAADDPEPALPTVAPTRSAVVVLAQEDADLPPGDELDAAVLRALDPAERTNFHDFGRVAIGPVLERTFVLLNTGDQPVTLQQIRPTCSCTEIHAVAPHDDPTRIAADPERSMHVIEPGERADLTLRIHTPRVQKKNVDKLATFRMQVGAGAGDSPLGSGGYVMFEMHVVVDEPFYTHPRNPVDLGAVPRSGLLEGSATVLQDERSELGARVVGIGEAPDGVAAELRHEVQFGKDHWWVDVRVEPPHEPGVLRYVVPVQAVDQAGEPIADYPVEFRARVVEDVELYPSFAFVRDQEVELTLTAHVPGSRLRVLEAAPADEHAHLLAVEAIPTQPDSLGRASRWRVVLRRLGEQTEPRLRGTVILRTDDPRAATIELPYDLIRS